jgi:hypothetical protein
VLVCSWPAAGDDESNASFRQQRLVRPADREVPVAARSASLPTAISHGYAAYPVYSYTYAYPYSWLWPAYSYGATGYYYAAPSYYPYATHYYPFAYYSQPYFGYTPYSSLPPVAASYAYAPTTYAYYGPPYGSGFWIGLSF